METNATTPTALAIRHVHFEDLGVLEPILAARGYRVRYLDAGIDDLDVASIDDAALLVVLGGPIGTNDTDGYPFLRIAKAAVAHRVHSGRPTLGICLGAQLLAEAMGAQVRPTGAVEIGYAPLELTADGIASPLRGLQGVPVLHWHGDEFDIPAGARHLARTPGFPNQAFSTDSVLGLQFHLEADHRAIERWLIGHAHELHHNGIDPDRIRVQARTHGPRLERAAVGVFGTWLDGLEGTEHRGTGQAGSAVIETEQR